MTKETLIGVAKKAGQNEPKERAKALKKAERK